MKQLPSAEFRKLYTSENEPVEVTSHGKVIGTWIPVGADIAAPDAEFSNGDEEGSRASPTRFTIRPQLKPRPVMEAREKPVLDPLELKRHEAARNEEFHNRAFQRRKD